MEINSVKRLPNLLLIFSPVSGQRKLPLLDDPYTFRTSHLKESANLSDCLSSFQWLCKRENCHPSDVEMTFFFYEKLQKSPTPLSKRRTKILSLGHSSYSIPFEKFWLRAAKQESATFFILRTG